ncbi:MAG: transposase [Opitutaceae bacterium]|nr:transposase [Opitutaceae bacterium]
MFDAEGNPVDVAVWLEGPGHRQCAQRTVTLKGRARPMRLCAIRVSRKVAQRQRDCANESARRNGRKPSALSLPLCGCIVVGTSLPEEPFGARSVLRLYRLRWQIEPAFKRLKSLPGTGHVPKIDPRSSRAWLQSKLPACLLTEKIILESEVFPPWGFLLPETQPMG